MCQKIGDLADCPKMAQLCGANGEPADGFELLPMLT